MDKHRETARLYREGRAKCEAHDCITNTMVEKYSRIRPFNKKLEPITIRSRLVLMRAFARYNVIGLSIKLRPNCFDPLSERYVGNRGIAFVVREFSRSEDTPSRSAELPDTTLLSLAGKSVHSAKQESSSPMAARVQKLLLLLISVSGSMEPLPEFVLSESRLKEARDPMGMYMNG